MYMIRLLIGALCVVCCTSIKDGQDYDFIVIGIESGGSIMAARLSEPDNNWTVLALDRGGTTDSINGETYDAILVVCMIRIIFQYHKIICSDVLYEIPDVMVLVEQQ
jgi:choline dehydrogenase-like flavoprotein